MATENRLAEIRERIEKRAKDDFYPWRMSREDAIFLFTRIKELERLVPDADFLDMLRDEFKYSLTPEYGLILEGLAAAIRKYRKARDGQS